MLHAPCVMNSDYARATLYGQRPKHHSAYRAFLAELSQINKLSALIGNRSPLGVPGEDLSIGHFKAVEYQPAGGMVAADRVLRARLASSGRRALMRRTGLSQHTLEAICKGRRVRSTALRRVIAVLASAE